MVSYVFYKNDYLGIDISEDEFEIFLKRAKRKIDSIINFQNIPANFKNNYNYAICAQIEYIYTLGIQCSIGITEVSSATVGNFSYTDGNKDVVKADIGSHGVSPDVIDYLKPTGLLFKGVNCIG